MPRRISDRAKKVLVFLAPYLDLSNSNPGYLPTLEEVAGACGCDSAVEVSAVCIQHLDKEQRARLKDLRKGRRNRTKNPNSEGLRQLADFIAELARTVIVFPEYEEVARLFNEETGSNISVHHVRRAMEKLDKSTSDSLLTIRGIRIKPGSELALEIAAFIRLTKANSAQGSFPMWEKLAVRFMRLHEAKGGTAFKLSGRQVRYVYQTELDQNEQREIQLLRLNPDGAAIKTEAELV